MSKPEFKNYMTYQINFLKSHELWDENWLAQNSQKIGFALSILWKLKKGKVSL